ncbi:MAG TPA: hypothetical protein VK897_12845 [Anaerolineales bacterium]|nr:hypothetical protein [Anaerolineales bacterium]
MKQRFSIILIVLSLLVALVGVAAAPMASGTVQLVGVQYVPHKGPVFTFEVSGKFSRSELKGKVYVQGGGSYNLHCTQLDDSTVKCNASQKVADVNVSLTWGGSTFWTYVPGAPAESNSAATEYCYTIYDFDLDLVWHPYGSHCQDIPAEYDDEIIFYNPDWEDEYIAVFMPEGPSCSGLYERAYYYPYCDEFEIPE